MSNELKLFEDKQVRTHDSKRGTNCTPLGLLADDGKVSNITAAESAGELDE